MGPETVATVVIVAIIVAALALFLIAYALRLARLSFTVGTIVIGVRAIAAQVQPLESVINGVAGDVIQIDDALGGLIALATGGGTAEAPESMHDAVTRARSGAPAAVEEDLEDEYEEEEAYEEEAYEDEDEEAEEAEYDEEEAEEAEATNGAGSMRQAVAAARERLRV